jgi:hypothetical protein
MFIPRIFTNIFFSIVLNFFLKKKIFLKFWHSILELLSIDPAYKYGIFRSSSENTWKMNLQPILKKNSPWTHMEFEWDLLGVVGKLVRYVVYLSKRKNWKKMYFLLWGCPNNKWSNFGLKEF